MLLEFTLYLLIGFTGLLIVKATSPKGFLKDVMIVILWPFYILLKYVEWAERAKMNSRRYK